MKKEMFIRIMAELQKIKNQQDTFSKLLLETWDEEQIVDTTNDTIDAVVDLLDDYFNDENDLIDWFIYDLDFGKNFVSGTFTVEGHSMSLRTPEHLYHALKHEYVRELSVKKEWEKSCPKHDTIHSYLRKRLEGVDGTMTFEQLEELIVKATEIYKEEK